MSFFFVLSACAYLARIAKEHFVLSACAYLARIAKEHFVLSACAYLARIAKEHFLHLIHGQTLVVNVDWWCAVEHVTQETTLIPDNIAHNQSTNTAGICTSETVPVN
jgi:hypothetical protein